ncbi:hypothetical protein [Streptomyces sp. MI02-7b]|uniref:hypothetical protein n=1 Tax=Streptomyces sp. MI02-7b TaxID=462941 RepID=UPI0029B3D9A6|nr:hypothetical protein [Streptomyces sp. MI02-7b]MDX3075384.1 hypothetical protein [Streptomyces sp. MI02-7b]
MPYTPNAGPCDSLTPENAVVLFIDHQIGLMQLIDDMALETAKSNVIGLARAAKTLLEPFRPGRPPGPIGHVGVQEVARRMTSVSGNSEVNSGSSAPFGPQSRLVVRTTGRPGRPSSR